MILIIGLFCIIISVIVGIIAFFRSEKPLKVIIDEAKYEIHYNIIGFNGLVEDFLGKTKNATDLPNKSGKVAVITGGARGIGTEVVKMLLKCDFHVVIGCRNVAAGEKVESLARSEGITTGSTCVFNLDVASLKSVRQFGEIISKKYPKIHVLINNAGIMFVPFAETEDGFESHFAVNYLGHFLLTHLLLPNLIASGDETGNARVVNVSSCAHYTGEIHFNDINMKENYIAQAAYGQSKLAQILFSNYLEHKMLKEQKPVSFYSVHPGIVDTDLFDGTPIKKYLPFLPKLIFKNVVQGATPIVFCAVSKNLEGKGGVYISNCRKKATSRIAQSLDLQERLFDFSNKLCGIEEYGKVH